MTMPCSNTQAEIDNDTAITEYANSQEYRASQLTLKDERHTFINNILHNIDVTIGDNTYDLTDVFSGIDANSFLWQTPIKVSAGDVELNYFLSCGDIHDNEPSDMAKLYAAGKVDAGWNPVIQDHVNFLADSVLGELDD